MRVASRDMCAILASLVTYGGNSGAALASLSAWEGGFEFVLESFSGHSRRMKVILG